jgi:aerobic carbon-monoxide dehydrogenase small subunit
MKKAVQFSVNGEAIEALVEPRTHLADFLRENLRLTGTHLGCEHGVCGACTVLIDGEPVRSCITFAAGCDGREVRTIEGFGDDVLMNELRTAFTREHALQCGFCTPGMLIMSRDIAQRMPQADEQAIRVELSGNLCRCTGYVGIVNAVKSVCANASAGVVASIAAPILPKLAPFTPQSVAAVTPIAVGASAATPIDLKGATRIEDGFDVPHAPAAVWRVLSDLPAATSCLPGAELETHDARSAKGRIKVKFGPMSAAFAGAANLERDDAVMSAVIRGAGTDALSGSRARGDIAYQLTPRDEGRATRVDITLDYSLVGPLAQFSRSGLVRDFAGRLIAEFGRNLATRIAAGTSAPVQAAELRAGGLLASVIWNRLLRWLGLRR